MPKLIVRSRNKSRKELSKLIVPKRTIYRMGSITPTEKITLKKHIEINTPLGCFISNNKYLMGIYLAKETSHYPKTFLVSDAVKNNNTIEGKLIMKHIHSSGGNGIYFFNNWEEFLKFVKEWSEEKSKNYIIQKYYTYTKEYRLHISKYHGCFYACRKMLKNDAEIRWHRHLNNCVFISPDNPLFDKPTCWENIIKDCIGYLKHSGIDIACFDVKVSKKNDYVILESNTAPGLGEEGIKVYKNIILDIVTNYDKYNII